MYIQDCTCCSKNERSRIDLKVLQICNYFYPNTGGIEQVARDIANSLCTANVEQKIICFNENASDGEYTCHREETMHDVIDGVEIIRCGCFTKFSSQSLSLVFARELRNLMESFKPDVVIFHYPNPFEAHYLLQYLDRDFKFVLYWHLDIVKQTILRNFFHAQTNILLRRADRIIATSPLYIQGSRYLSKYVEKCTVIPNCVSENRMLITEEIRERAKKIRAWNTGKIICFGVGRHIEYKGFRYLVEASRFLDDRFRIYIAGNGKLMSKLHKLAAADEKITFLGRVSNEDLLAYYLAMDIFCFPSITKNEAFGIALAEAMYCGKPAVTFTIPGSGVNYVCVNGETGLEVENRNVRMYAEAMRKLADNPHLRSKLGLAAKSRVEKNFLTSQFTENILGLVESL